MTKEQILESFQQLLDEKPVEHITIDTESFLALMGRTIQEAKDDIEYGEENSFTVGQIESQGYLRGLITALFHFKDIYENNEN